MRTRCLAAVISIAVVALSGCGADDKTPQPPSEPFALDGAWLYLGPSDEPHDLTITDSTMAYKAVDGTWSSNWSIKSYDNATKHFQATLVSGMGTYLPAGQNHSGAYEVKDNFLTLQVANGLTAYPPLKGVGSCTEGAAIPDCRLYVKQN